MARLTLEEVLPQWNGDYELDLTWFTNRELHLIRELCGVYPPDIGLAIMQRDAGFQVALAGIALQRNGFDLHPEEWGLLWDTRQGRITLDLTKRTGNEKEDADATPLPEKDDSSVESSESSEPAKSASSGENSETESASQETNPSASGAPG